MRIAQIRDGVVVVPRSTVDAVIESLAIVTNLEAKFRKKVNDGTIALG
jgi:regulator of RNase E activity RraA|tara:strand:+ start:74 stop:217 length:144 start_codon:yes stop_codon:yes gene_type:complete